MALSRKYEEIVANTILKDEGITATKSYLGLSTYKPSELTKAKTAKEFGEHEPKESANWARVEIDNIEWTITKAEGETGATVYENKNAIKGGGGAGEFKKLSSEEYVLETAAVLPKAKQTEDGTTEILMLGKLTTKLTVNSASTLEVAAGGLKFEFE